MKKPGRDRAFTRRDRRLTGASPPLKSAYVAGIQSLGFPVLITGPVQFRDRSVIQWAHTADTVDRGPGKLPNTSSRLIAMAVSLVGEAQSVVLEMKCSPHDFRDYCAGLKEPPPDQFERLVALIIHEQGKMIAKNRELIAKNRELIAQCRGLTAKNDN